MKVLFVIPSLNYGNAARQLSLLAPNLPRERFEPRVCVLGRGGPLEKNLAVGGVPIDFLGWIRLIDLRPFWRLRQLTRSFRPDVIHAWGPAAFRAIASSIGKLGTTSCCPIVVGMPRAFRERGGGGLLDRWLLRRADRMAATGTIEADYCRRLGLPLDKLAFIPPAVELRQENRRTKEDILRSLSLVLNPADRLLACVGPLEPHKGFRDAIWAFDILRYLYCDVHLLMIGSGCERERLQQFSRSLQAEGQVHWVGDQADVPALLSLAEVVWVPSRSAGGVNVALEAMAAGRPVVASHIGALTEIVADGETGVLVAPGDKVGLARQTRLLLEDHECRRRLGNAGRLRAENFFAAPDMVQRYARLYESAGQRSEVNDTDF